MRDARAEVEWRSMLVARTFDEVRRGATVTDVSAGTSDRTQAIRVLLEEHGCSTPHRASADLLSRSENGDRVIEVKGGALPSPRFVIERELDTLTMAGGLGWLYVVTFVTRPRPVEVFAVRDPSRLPWTLESEATRPLGAFRSGSHEARYRIEYEEIRAAGELLDLTGLPLPAWGGAVAEWIPGQGL